MRFLGVFVLLFGILEILSIVMAVKLLGGLTAIVLMGLSFFIGVKLMNGRGNVARTLMGAAVLRGAGQVSLYQLLWPLRIPLAGILLMLPGFLSDILAVCLLLPVRGGKTIGDQGSQQQTFSGNGSFGAFRYESRSSRQNDEDIIEGDFTTVQGNNKRPSHTQNQHNVIEHNDDLR